ncbi:hypothetical protein [Alloalcanivorax sp.]|jgi:hypothetical protein|uniref:hypothetical protein n=1 Tax=Alloalcanivorax sp. TaxID=3020835 RepID=UPI000E8F88F8|nr:hypothetical protein [Pseudomonadota bacterium]HBS80452.1 hypothetical protein [Pseudomonas sp.]
MDWVQIVSAVGVGALLTKLLDIVWLQRSIRESEKRKWLREQRLRVYSTLAAEVLSMGKSMESREDVFVGYSLAAEAMLLAGDEKLANDIEHFFTMLANIFGEGRKADNDPARRSEEDLEGAYQVVVRESRRLVKELRASLHEKI